MTPERSKLLEELLTEAMEHTAKTLLDRAKGGTITSAEAGVVAKLCKDNQITIDITENEMTAEQKANLEEAAGADSTEDLPFPFP